MCKKYYVHPGLIQLYEENKLVKYLRELDAAEGESSSDETLVAEEGVLMKILKLYIHAASQVA